MPETLPLRSAASARPRILVRAALACAALLLAAAPAAAQEGPRPAERRGFLEQLVGMPRLDYLARLARPLQVPVAGVQRSRLRDSYLEGRSGGRTHEAIDIHAPRGTPVLAAADGKILRMRSGGLGGVHLYQLDDDGRTRYYYAHLERWAEGLREGDRVARGDTIGYVGDTGNAQKGDFHLHFAVSVLENTRQWWTGSRPLNPYALLTGREGER